MIQKYYQLTKPGVLYGNVITGVAGFLLASGYYRQFDAGLFVAAIGGMSLIIASACVLNNVLDQDIDRLMERTKKRGVASGEVSSRAATVFSAVLGLAGLLILSLWTNWLVVGIGVFGFVTYVWLYGALSKRRSIHGTLVGSISGAMPILAGYCAVSDRLDVAAVLVFLMLFFWQFPEFYSIAIYRKKEYATASIPVMPIVKGNKSTIIQIFVYTVLFLASALLLTICGYTGWIYFAATALLGVYWLRIGWQGFSTGSQDAWARRMFHAALVVLLASSTLLSIGALLP